MMVFPFSILCVCPFFFATQIIFVWEDIVWSNNTEYGKQLWGLIYESVMLKPGTPKKVALLGTQYSVFIVDL